jgi:hypothetical protein
MVGTNGNRGPTAYEVQIADFICMLSETTEDRILIHHPEEIGDTYDATKALIARPCTRERVAFRVRLRTALEG